MKKKPLKSHFLPISRIFYMNLLKKDKKFKAFYNLNIISKF